MFFDDQQTRRWEKRNPQQFVAGRQDARKDIEAGLLEVKVSIDGTILDPSLMELLWQKGIDSDLYSDVGGPHPAYVIAYNHEMEGEVDRRYGNGTMRSLWERAKQQGKKAES